MFRMEWLGMLATLGFAVYMGTMMSFIMGDLYGEEVSGRLPYIVDWLYLVMMPILGSVMNRTVFGIWRSDGYTKRLALLRVYPIPIGVIVGARIVQSILLILVSTAVVLSLIYTLSPELRDAVSAGNWINFGILLICYSLISNLFFVWLEIGHSGRIYLLGYFAWLALVTIAVIASDLLGVDDQAFAAALRWTESDVSAAIWPCGLILSSIAIWIGYRWIVGRVGTRSVTF